MPTTDVGYSDKPLHVKLGYVAGLRVWVSSAPPEYVGWLGAVAAELHFLPTPDRETDIVHVFHDDSGRLAADVHMLRRLLKPDAVVWVSWPKRASRVPTDITEDVIRDVALPMGWVDVKVCAVSDIWSGLKLVVRKHLR